MAHSTPKSHPLQILYVAATEERAGDGADALEAISDGPDRAVHPAASVEEIRDAAADADCVVFAEPLADDSDSHLLEAVDASGSTPLVLFSEGSPAVPSSEVFDGFVRRDADDAAVHLLDEIVWLCERGADRSTDESPDGGARARTDAAVLEVATDVATCRDRDRLFDRLVGGVVDILEFEYCWVATINFGTLVPRATAAAVPDDQLGPIPLEDPLSVSFRARQPIRIADLEPLEAVAPPFEHVRSLCSVPVGDVGVLYVASELPDAFDATDLELLEGLCGTAAAILERNWIETGIDNERDRLRRDRQRLTEEYDRLTDERERIVEERNALVSLLANVSEPTIRYELVDGRPVVADVNEPLEVVFGDEAEAVAGTPLAEYAVPNGLAEAAATLVDAVRAGEQRQLSCRRDTVEGVREFVITVVPLETGASGQEAPTSADGLVVYDDVTESRRRKRTLAAAASRLETIVELIDEEGRPSLNAADGYLELAEKTGDREHFETVEAAHDRLSAHLETLNEVASGDGDATEPVTVQEVAQLAWIDVDTRDATLATEGDVIIEANRDGLRELFEYALQAVIEVEREDEPADESITVTVGTTDDGFYVAGDRPSGSDGASRDTDPDSGRFDDDPTDVQLGLLERIADAHGWDVGVAEDDDGTAFAFRGVEAVDAN
ncbi:GAF domain-containing protein [Natrarchaeobius oligotrophus]|uniref:GAF domain-containing protein n=1 Tax=Natrarchaeobius chitinivorans TaxID=1679083 RepID=A0A3N6N0F9_NATCH|nr:GAF domain-containing protein [Natrarchaeobius chitinivorans]RQH00937.1 GAF domain-containing protein [Natrarchaeobius chitinivorans]